MWFVENFCLFEVQNKRIGVSNFGTALSKNNNHGNYVHMENIENVEKVEDNKCNKRYAIQRGAILKTRKTRNTNKKIVLVVLLVFFTLLVGMNQTLITG